MNNESGEKVYRKLRYYYDGKIPVHFRLAGKNGWKNGKVASMFEHDLSFTLIEFKEGELLFLCEDIDPDSIVAYKEKEL